MKKKRRRRRFNNWGRKRSNTLAISYLEDDTYKRGVHYIDWRKEWEDYVMEDVKLTKDEFFIGEYRKYHFTKRILEEVIEHKRMEKESNLEGYSDTYIETCIDYFKEQLDSIVKHLNVDELHKAKTLSEYAYDKESEVK